MRPGRGRALGARARCESFTSLTALSEPTREAPLAQCDQCTKVHGVLGEQLMTRARSGAAADPPRITIAPEGRSWAVKHNGGFLGHAASEHEARGIAEHLVAWLEDQGRPVEFTCEERARGAADAAPPPSAC
jgi:hypothetical protein